MSNGGFCNDAKPPTHALTATGPGRSKCDQVMRNVDLPSHNPRTAERQLASGNSVWVHIPETLLSAAVMLTYGYCGLGIFGSLSAPDQAGNVRIR